jgi:hypothetical protein
VLIVMNKSDISDQSSVARLKSIMRMDEILAKATCKCVHIQLLREPFTLYRTFHILKLMFGVWMRSSSSWAACYTASYCPCPYRCALLLTIGRCCNDDPRRTSTVSVSALTGMNFDMLLKTIIKFGSEGKEGGSRKHK